MGQEKSLAELKIIKILNQRVACVNYCPSPKWDQPCHTWKLHDHQLQLSSPDIIKMAIAV